MDSNLLINLYRIFVYIRADIKNPRNFSWLAAASTCVSQPVNNEIFVKMLFEEEDSIKGLKRENGEVCTVTNNVKEFLITMMELGEDALVEQNYEKAVDVFDAIHNLPEILLNYDEKRWAVYWDTYMTYFLNKWNIELTLFDSNYWRDSLLKVYLDNNQFNIVKEHGCQKVKYLSKSDELEIKPMDFIIFVNEEKDEIIRNFIGWSKNWEIEYTTAWNGVTSDNFALIAVITNLYASIQHIRHGTPTKRKWFCKKFPYDIVRNELAIIKLCVELLQENIGLREFQKCLKKCAQKTENYRYWSTVSLLRQYPWKYEKNKECQLALDKINQALEEIEMCMEDRRGLENIWRLAYQVHNEPPKILEEN